MARRRTITVTSHQSARSVPDSLFPLLEELNLLARFAALSTLSVSGQGTHDSEGYDRVVIFLIVLRVGTPVMRA